MFTLNPNGFTAKKAKIFQAEKVKKSISYLLNECSKKLKLQDEKISLACSIINNISELSPEIHFLHYQLQTAMRHQDVSNARLYLNKITASLCEESHSVIPLSISSIGASEWENFAITEALRLSREDCGREAEIRAVTQAELELSANSISSALKTIENHDPDMFEVVQEQFNPSNCLKVK